jgi:nucleoside-diphosphate-sugar epimerase
LLFLTGGTGFIGQRLLARVSAGGQPGIRYLVRRSTLSAQIAGRAEVVVGDLCEPSTYVRALRDTDVVVHLAAATGKARPAEYFAVNEAGTRALLETCVASGVRRVIFVSSIAATYANKTAYYYAQSKQQAEQAVRNSGLNYLIVRPTIVLGTGSPIWNRLVGLARMPIMPVLSDGAVRVQPIHVDDVVTFLASMIESRRLPDTAVDLGGPEVLTFEDLLRRIRRAVSGRESPIVHVSARSAIALLAAIERWLPPILPVTAGQLSAFVNDSVATYDPLVKEKIPSMKSIDEMLKLLGSR